MSEELAVCEQTKPATRRTAAAEPSLVPVFYGRIDQTGKPILDDPGGFQRAKEFLAGKEIEIRLQKRRRQRSIGQNAYFHGVVLPMITEAAGYEVFERQEVKDALKAKFLPAMTRGGVSIDAYRTMTDTLTRTLDAATEALRERGEAAVSSEKMAEFLEGLRKQMLDVTTEDSPDKLRLVRSTADLDTAEFTRFIEDCRRWAAQTFHINIPDPNEVA